ncbi:hypothetical protein Tco_1130483 [Tanacetum coccineum]
MPVLLSQRYDTSEFVEDDEDGDEDVVLRRGGGMGVPEGQQQAAPVMETTGQGSGSVPEPKRPERESALRQPTLTTWIDPEGVASPATAEAEGFLVELGAQVKMQGGLIHDHMRPVLALESWAGQTDAQKAALWHALEIYKLVNQELDYRYVEEEAFAWLDLAEIVASMRRGQEPGGDV